jgi:acyl-CoA synthetase (NDP forming)
MPSHLERLLSPRSVAVVGASPRTGSVAGEILRNLQRCAFSGILVPVNPKYEDVSGLRCYPTIEALPEPVDLAVLAINRNIVLDSVVECGEKGIRDLVIVTAGFKESDEEGTRLERALQRLIAKYDLNVVGPNCMGLINTSQDVRLNASFSRWFPSEGEIAFVSQSGSLGETLLECFARAGLGVSLFVNLGNRAGLSENDFLSYLVDDEDCRAVFLYLESFAEPTAFRSLVERLGPTKPVVVLKAGRTEAGAAAVASHTGSLASPDAVVDAFLRQCGAVRVSTIEETLTALRALERGILPRGNRVVILTNAGGAGIIAADACERAGMDVPPLDEQTRAALAEFLPPEAGLGNPIDLIATATAADYERSLRRSLRAADSAIVIFRPPLVLTDAPTEVADAIVRVAVTAPDQPIVVSTLSREVTSVVERLREDRVPVYAMPETAVDALAVLQRVRELRTTVSADIRKLHVDSGRARRVVERVFSDGRSGLFFDEGAEVLAAYGIDVCSFSYLDSVREGRDWLERVGFPVVAKVDSPEMFHRFERGAVITGIENEDALNGAVARLQAIASSLGLTGARILVQKTVVGRELIFGLERDPAFGPVVMFGIGGTLVEALRDVAFAVAPVTECQAEQTIRSIRAFPLLGAFRGQPAVDLTPLSRILAALAQLGLDLPEIGEVDLNPIIVAEEGTVAVDLLIKLAEARR